MDHPQKGARFAPPEITSMGLELIPSIYSHPGRYLLSDCFPGVEGREV